MAQVTLKHLKRESSRDFDMVGYDSANRAEWIRKNLDKYETIAVIDLDVNSVKKAFRVTYDATQNIEESWVDNLKRLNQDIRVDRARSTSVGDIVICNGIEYFVDSYGFSPISEYAY